MFINIDLIILLWFITFYIIRLWRWPAQTLRHHWYLPI